MLDMLYELEKMLSHAGFVRASKSVVLNVEKLTGIKTMVNSKLEAKLSNGESVCVCLDTISLLSEVKSINVLIGGEVEFVGEDIYGK